MDFTELTVIFTLGICTKFCLSDPHGSDKWVRAASFPQNNNQNILLGIDQRLRGIDSIRHIVSRNEISLDALTNHIEIIETRLTGLQSTMQHKFDAIAAAVSSAEMKYELLIDQMSQKLQTDLDRIDHKLNSAEARLETTVNKIQNQMEINFQKVETKQLNVFNELQKVLSGIDSLQTQSVNSDQKYNRTLGLLVNHLQEIRHEHADKKEHLKNLTSLVTGLHPNKSEGWTQSDAPIIPKQIQIMKAEISGEAQKISSKMSNMYNDMWRNIKDLEVIFKSVLSENNNKSRQLHDDLRQMLDEEKRNSDSFLDVIIQSVLSNIQTQLSDLQRRNDNNFQRIVKSHEIHGDSCHKVKGIIENRVALILEKIYDTFTNRTDKFSKQITEVGELVIAEGKQLSRAISKTDKDIITLANENSQDHKQLDKSITNIIEKTEDISMSSQDIQMQTLDINEILLKYLKLLTEFTTVIYNNFETKSNKSLNLSNETVTNKLSILEANYSNGIIKILTDHANNEEFVEKEEDRTSKGIRIPLSKLNHSATTSDIVAVIGESKHNKQEASTPVTQTVSEEKDRDDEDDFEAQEEFGEDDMKTVDTNQLYLSYIKYLRGHLTPQEFLEDAIPGSKYDSLRDMARQLKRTTTLPREMIKNIEDMAQGKTDKDKFTTDKEIGSTVKKLNQQHSKYESLNEDENYDEIYDAPQRK